MPRDAYVMLLDGIPGAPLPLPQRTRGFYATASTQERLSRAYQEAMVSSSGLSGVGVFADLADVAEDRRRAMAIATAAKNACHSTCTALHAAANQRTERQRCIAGCDTAFNLSVGAIEAAYPAGTTTPPSEDAQRRVDELLAEQERRNEEIRRRKEEEGGGGSGGGMDNQQMMMWGLLGVGGLIAVALILRS